jgi:two-component system aerobic respiration control sensor histidine kinase ArcB
VKSDVPLRVLLAEDEPVAAHFASAMVESLGHSVVVATTGQEAWLYLKSAAFDVAILDLGLPEMCGTDVARRIRRFPQRLSRAPVWVIVLTAGTLAEKDRINAGVDVVVEKPITRAALVEALRVRVESIATLQNEESQPQRCRVVAK